MLTNAGHSPRTARECRPVEWARCGGGQGYRKPGVRKVKTDWDAWNHRSLADEPFVRLILDGTVVRVRLDPKPTSISTIRSSTLNYRSRRDSCRYLISGDSK